MISIRFMLFLIRRVHMRRRRDRPAAVAGSPWPRALGSPVRHREGLPGRDGHAHSIFRLRSIRVPVGPAGSSASVGNRRSGRFHRLLERRLGRPLRLLTPLDSGKGHGRSRGERHRGAPGVESALAHDGQSAGRPWSPRLPGAPGLKRTSGLAGARTRAATLGLPARQVRRRPIPGCVRFDTRRPGNRRFTQRFYRSLSHGTRA